MLESRLERISFRFLNEDFKQVIPYSILVLV